ncbi:MAG: ABC transporter permease [Acidobacteriota bacterium]
MTRDLKFALRTLLKNPGPSAVAIFVLALGIGANTVVFSLAYGLVIKPLSFEDPDRLVRVFGTETARGRDRQRVSEATVEALREQGDAFVAVAGARNMGLSVTDSERPLNPLMRQVTTGWFEMLGVPPQLGRTFTAEEHHQGARVVVLQHEFWQGYFGGDPDVIGQTVELDGAPYEVIGVMPAAYRNDAYANMPVLWLPHPETAAPDPQSTNFTLVARLADGASLATARASAERVVKTLATTYPETHAVRGLRLETLHGSMVERFEPALMVLFGAVGFVLLIACSNVAHLLLTRALGRGQEIAVRQALGAGRRHLLRQLIAESALISLAGAGLGVLAAFWGIGPLAQLAPSNTPVPMIDRVQIEPSVLLFSLALACLTTLFFGLLPLRQLFRDAAGWLSAGASRSIGGRSRSRLRSTLVITELALSMVLLVGAGLTVRSLQHLRGLELGFDAEHLLAGRIGARGGGFDAPERWAEFHRQAVEEISRIPGLDQVGGIEFLPTFASGFGATAPVAVQGVELPADQRPRAVLLSTLPDFFEVAGQPMLGGRDFNYHDTAEGEQVAIISRSLAQLLWGDADPLGKTLVVGEGDSQTAVRLVGLAGDLRGLADNPAPPPVLYRPQAQRPTSNFTVYARQAGASETQLLALLPAVEDAVWSISRDAPVYRFTTMAQVVRDLEWQPRFLGQLLTGFALLALVLAATGVYSVLAFAIRERHREIGIRMAVGAGRGDIVRMVGREALWLALVGVGIGIVGALLASKGLESQLLGVTARDPVTYGVLAVALTTVALLASYLPARKATRVDPVIALNSE